MPTLTLMGKHKTAPVILTECANIQSYIWQLLIYRRLLCSDNAALHTLDGVSTICFEMLGLLLNVILAAYIYFNSNS